MKGILSTLAITALLMNSFIRAQEVLTLLEEKNEGEEKIEGCWLKAYGRGVGNPISTCNNGLEKNGGLCYPRCNNGYNGVGPVCWQQCPSNYRDDGAFCYKPAPYGRGSGYANWNGDKCNKENPQTGCEKWGLMWYPKCLSSFNNVGCCICSPICPSGMTDIGISCTKGSYSRGWGKSLECKTEQIYDAGLCYDPCENDKKGIGPVCWDKSCPEGYNQCGALCIKGQGCAGKIKSYMEGVIDIVTDFATHNPVKAIIDIGKFAEGFMYDLCK